MTWKDYFKQAFKGEPFTPLGFEGEDKNLLAHNSLEAYLEWFAQDPYPEGMPGRDDGFYARELTNISRLKMPKTIAEFGTSIGIGTLMLSRLNPGARIWTIDKENEIPIPGDGRWPAGHIAKINDCKNVEYIQDLSWEFEPPDAIDLCFIDGDHSYYAVLEDSWVAWENKSDNWAIVWHDYRTRKSDHPDVTMAVDEFCLEVGVKLNRLEDSATAWIEGGRS